MVDDPNRTTVRQRFLVFGATGQTGRRFVGHALEQGHKVRALARTPAKLHPQPGLDIRTGSITDLRDLDELLDELLAGIDAVIVMLGDAAAQQHRMINTEFVARLVPAMRRAHVRRLLYQAGGLSAPPGERLSLALWAIRNTIARRNIGQHRDNEAVMRYLTSEAPDIDWVVHRAGIGSDGPSRGRLRRSRRHTSIATFDDCAAYSLRLIDDPTATHTCDTSTYRATR